MNPKEIVKSFYKSDALIDSDIVKNHLHPDVIIDWNSSKGFIQLDYQKIIELTNELSRSYIRSKVKISHILHEDNLVSVSYSHHVKTIENPREDFLLGRFMVIWEIKDGKLYRGYQMSQGG